jgi:hypothetical protein
MSPTELADIFENATTPLRLTMASGDTVIVDNPKRTIIEGLTAYVGQADNPASRLAQRVRWVSIPNINIVEKIDPRLLTRKRR